MMQQMHEMVTEQNGQKIVSWESNLYTVLLLLAIKCHFEVIGCICHYWQTSLNNGYPQSEVAKNVP